MRITVLAPSYRFDKEVVYELSTGINIGDLERQNGACFALFLNTELGIGPYFALFHRIRVRCRGKTIVRLNLPRF